MLKIAQDLEIPYCVWYASSVKSFHDFSKVFSNPRVLLNKKLLKKSHIFQNILS